MPATARRGRYWPAGDSSIDGQAHRAELDVQTIMCYHGGVVVVNANQQLQQVAQELAQK